MHTVLPTFIIKADGQIAQDRSLLRCKTGKDFTHIKLSWFGEWTRCPHGAHRAAGALLTLEVCHLLSKYSSYIFPLPLHPFTRNI